MNCFLKQFTSATRNNLGITYFISQSRPCLMPSNLFPSSRTRNSDSTSQHRDVQSNTSGKLINQLQFSAATSSNCCWYQSCHQWIKWQMSGDWVSQSINARDAKCCVMGICCPILQLKRSHIYTPCCNFVLKHTLFSVMQTLWPSNPLKALQCTFKRPCCYKRGLDHLFWSMQLFPTTRIISSKRSRFCQNLWKWIWTQFPICVWVTNIKNKDLKPYVKISGKSCSATTAS